MAVFAVWSELGKDEILYQADDSADDPIDIEKSLAFDASMHPDYKKKTIFLGGFKDITESVKKADNKNFVLDSMLMRFREQKLLLPDWVSKEHREILYQQTTRATEYFLDSKKRIILFPQFIDMIDKDWTIRIYVNKNIEKFNYENT